MRLQDCRARGRRFRGLAGAVAWVALAAGPASAVPQGPVTPGSLAAAELGVPERWSAARAEAFASLDRTRRLVASGRLADSVRAASGLAGATVIDAHTTRLSSPAVGVTLPAQVSEPIQELLERFRPFYKGGSS